MDQELWLGYKSLRGWKARMPQENVPDKPKKTVLETVLDDFISNLGKDAAVEKTTVLRLQQLVKAKEFGIEKLRTALFSEDAL